MLAVSTAELGDAAKASPRAADEVSKSDKPRAASLRRAESLMFSLANAFAVALLNAAVFVVLVSGSTDAALLSPTTTGGGTDPIPSARSGSWPKESSHRPIQPEVIGSSGDPVCQISIDVK